MNVPAVDPARVMALLEFVQAAGSDNLSLNEIDGVFYWCAFRAADIDPLFGVQSKYNSLPGNRAAAELLLGGARRGQVTFKDFIYSHLAPHVDDDTAARMSISGVDRKLKHERHSEIASDTNLQDIAERLVREYPTIQRWLDRQELPSLRGIRVVYTSWSHKDAQSWQSLAAQIQERSTTGVEVADALHSSDAGPDPIVWEGMHDFPEMAVARMESALLEPWVAGEVEEETFISSPIVGLIRGPMLNPLGIDRHRIEVRVGLPLPPHEVIAAYYDFAVRGRMNWHERLEDRSNNQDHAIAVRTWAIGLLIATKSWKRESATATVCTQMGLHHPISKTQFEHDRDVLLDRVELEDVFMAMKPKARVKERIRRFPKWPP